MRLGNHWIEARKLAFFITEQAVFVAALTVSSLIVIHSLGQRAEWFPVLMEAAVVTVAVQAGLYLADLYDFGVAWADAPRATRLLKTLGAVTIVCGIGTLLLPGPSAARA